MTTLAQLKGTEDLLDGFEAFLVEWLSPASPEHRGQKRSKEEAGLFDQLPASVRQCYEIVDRWPGSRIAEGGGQDQLITSLRLEQTWIPIIAENQCIFSIFASTHRDDCLFVPRWDDDD